MALDIHQLNCFVAVAEELHFGRAAARLFMTQPPLSRQIQLLEHALGVKLFERNNRSVRITAAGRVFLTDALRLLNLAEQAAISARRASRGETGRITIGFTSIMGFEFIPQLLAAARQALPYIDVVLKEMVSISQVEALEAGTIDLGFMRSLPIRHTLHSEVVAREPLVVALPQAHPLAQCEEIAVEAMHEIPFVMYTPTEGRYFYGLISSLFGAHNVVPDYVQYIDQSHTILGLVRAGFGISIMPASVRLLHVDKIVFRPIKNITVFAETCMASRMNPQNPALETFRQFISQHLNGRLG